MVRSIALEHDYDVAADAGCKDMHIAHRFQLETSGGEPKSVNPQRISLIQRNKNLIYA